MQTVKHTQYIKRTELNMDAAVFISWGREKTYFFPCVTFNCLRSK